MTTNLVISNKDYLLTHSSVGGKSRCRAVAQLSSLLSTSNHWNQTTVTCHRGIPFCSLWGLIHFYTYLGYRLKSVSLNCWIEMLVPCWQSDEDLSLLLGPTFISSHAFHIYYFVSSLKYSPPKFLFNIFQ